MNRLPRTPTGRAALATLALGAALVGAAALRWSSAHEQLQHATQTHRDAVDLLAQLGHTPPPPNADAPTTLAPQVGVDMATLVQAAGQHLAGNPLSPVVLAMRVDEDDEESAEKPPPAGITVEPLRLNDAGALLEALAQAPALPGLRATRIALMRSSPDRWRMELEATVPAGSAETHAAAAPPSPPSKTTPP